MTYLHAAILFPAELDLAKLALANGITQDEIAKLRGSLMTSAVVVSAAAATSFIVGAARADNRQRLRVFRGR